MLPTTFPTKTTLQSVLSSPRFDTYLLACDNDSYKASQLYAWNAAVSAASMLPAHFAEISIRNAASYVLERVYGSRWPWEETFLRSLPAPRGRKYNPRSDLEMVSRRYTTTGKVIAELKLAFWAKLFTARNDTRLWESNILNALPGSQHTDTRILRAHVYTRLNALRRLRNRIAHHEPIFTRELNQDLIGMKELIRLRSTSVSEWVSQLETVSPLLPLKSQYLHRTCGY